MNDLWTVVTFLDNYVITIMARLEYGRLVTNKNELQLHTIRKRELLKIIYYLEWPGTVGWHEEIEKS